MLIATQSLLWFAMNDSLLSLRANHAITEKSNNYNFVTIWKAAIESGQGALYLTASS